MRQALATIVLFGLLAGISHAQMPRWQSDVSLWASAMQSAPLKPRPAVNYAAAKMALGNTPDLPILQEHALMLALAPWVPAHQRHMTEHVVAYNLFQIAVASGDAARILPAYERLAIIWPEGSKTVRP